MSENSNDNRQILVIKDDEETTPSKWSMKKYGESIKKYKWWVSGITLGVAVAALLGVQYGYNSLKTTYEAQFAYNLALTETGDGNGTFIDGTNFNYLSIISEDSLLEAKASSDEFASIDVNGLLESNGIAITVNGYTSQTDGSFVVTTPVTYTISGKLSSLGDKNTATKFIRTLTDLLKDKNEKAINNFTISSFLPVDTVYSDLEFEDQISTLESQYKQILKVFNYLIQPSTNTTKTDGTEEETTTKKDTISIIKGNDTDTMETIISNFELSYKQGSSGTVFASLSSTLDSKKYVNYNPDDVQSTINKLEELGESDIEGLRSTIKKISMYQAQIDAIKADVLSDTSVARLLAEYSKSLLELSILKADYENELLNLGYNLPTNVTVDNIDEITLTGDGKIQKLKAVQNDTEEGRTYAAACLAFKNNILSYKEKLEKDVEEGTKIARYVYSHYNDDIYYVYPGVITTSGSISMWIGAAIGLVVGYLASSLICCSIYVNKEEETASADNV